MICVSLSRYSAYYNIFQEMDNREFCFWFFFVWCIVVLVFVLMMNPEQISISDLTFSRHLMLFSWFVSTTRFSSFLFPNSHSCRFLLEEVLRFFPPEWDRPGPKLCQPFGIVIKRVEQQLCCYIFVLTALLVKQFRWQK